MAKFSTEDKLPHYPVLYQEIIHALQPRQGGFFVDGTLGAGGHAWGILQASSPTGQLLGLDVDPQALELAKQRLAPFATRCVILQASYITLSEQLAHLVWSAVDGILLDLGISSIQVDTPQRGFSFLAEAPLDMRFDPRNPVTAADLVNNMSEGELADIFFRYGEERQARRIARAILAARPVLTTSQLAQIVSGSVSAQKSRTGSINPRSNGRHPKARGKIHPATRVFQALRIAVNQELQALEAVLPQAMAALAPGGRVAIISFHSLEDRIVKQFFRRESQDCLCPPRQPACTCGHRAALVEITRKPVQPGAEEITQNPRSRSARLRVAEKLPPRNG